MQLYFQSDASQRFGDSLMPLPNSHERLLTLPSLHVPMGLEEISEYPILAQCLEAWRANAAERLPVTVDPVEMPVEAIKAISLVEWDEPSDEWIVRLSATLMDQGFGRSMTGGVLSETYRPEVYPEIRKRLESILATGEPNLARHEFVGAKDRRWAYVRLILPLSSDGVKRDRYALIYDPNTFGQRIGT